MISELLTCVFMTLRGIFGFRSFETTDARLSGCQGLTLRRRAQAMRRSQSDGALAGGFPCRDERCGHFLGPLDTISLDGKFEADLDCERECPIVGTTCSLRLRVILAVVRSSLR